ncbi:MAG: MOSC domain-containing protein [Candidatus Eisenbacteria bacterium]|uniref:MOSC domain-containing protein n=1 Tax=Eiseniibacteriota bacterium TaxID=2212470 RepID=A0A538U6H0_UNCEI|nr:MAG: MOSC domain-containing protein [Candidatus Eisenbacteria bacterium]
MSAVVVALLASAMRGECLSLADATLLEDSGLEGDRHAKSGSRRALLVMEQEVLDALDLAPGVVREQITVRGVDLHRLVLGTRLRIGETLLGVEAHCAPCQQMDAIRPGLRAALEGRRGRFVWVVKGGRIAVGDSIEVEPPH